MPPLMRNENLPGNGMVIRDRFRAIRIGRLVGAALAALVAVLLMPGSLLADVLTISSLNPNTGSSVGGTSVQIDGALFGGACDDGNIFTTGDAISVDSVLFGSNPATSYIVNNNTRITATTPAGTGAVSVSVRVRLRMHFSGICA